MSGYPNGPVHAKRPLFVINHPHLHSVAMRDLATIATVDEFAEKGIASPEEVFTALAPHVESGLFRLDFIKDEVFIHTGNAGRPTPRHLPEAPVSLWEKLRSISTEEEAYLNWKSLRQLTAAGWETECATPQMVARMQAVEGAPVPSIGVYVGNNIVPVVSYPTSRELQSFNGPLERYENVRASCIAVLCGPQRLDETITAVRAWAMSRKRRPGLAVVVLEAPQFDPVLVTANDTSVSHKSVDRVTLEFLAFN